MGTTARIAQFEELPDGRMNVLVFGETRFRVTRTRHDHPYLSAQVEPLEEQAMDLERLGPPFEVVSDLFRTYLKSLFALSGRSLSTLQLPQDPACLSFAIASVLQVPHGEKQALLEMTDTEERLARESAILRGEIEAQKSLQGLVGGYAEPVDTQALSRLASLN